MIADARCCACVKSFCKIAPHLSCLMVKPLLLEVVSPCPLSSPQLSHWPCSACARQGFMCLWAAPDGGSDAWVTSLVTMERGRRGSHGAPAGRLRWRHGPKAAPEPDSVHSGDRTTLSCLSSFQPAERMAKGRGLLKLKNKKPRPALTFLEQTKAVQSCQQSRIQLLRQG